jgi:hypothetical protein
MSARPEPEAAPTPGAPSHDATGSLARREGTPAGEPAGQPLSHLRERWAMTIRVLRAPRVRIELYGSEQARSMYSYFTRRHPRIRVARNKVWGIALLPLGNTYGDYIDGRARKAMRQNCRRATQAGYRYEQVSPTTYFADILEINRSAPVRQGKPMRDNYLDSEQVREGFERYRTMHGIVDSQGHLRAYATMIEIGDTYMLTTLIGHAEALEHGVMYLLVSEIVRGCIAERDADGRPHWLMADTFWGAKRGLAYFKERCGFQPYTVSWGWTDNGPPAG